MASEPQCDVLVHSKSKLQNLHRSLQGSAAAASTLLLDRSTAAVGDTLLECNESMMLAAKAVVTHCERLSCFSSVVLVRRV
eukprot:2242-Heterococcus_DN1.PRE.2